jgi:hypothetical protein
LAKKRKKHKRDARTLKGKSLASLRRAISIFNSHEEDGRATSVLLHLQHSGEMLIKAALVQRGQKIFDKSTHKSKGFAKCLNLSGEHLQCTTAEVGALRTIDVLRDTEQHWFALVPEELLYLESRAFVTAFDAILHRIFGEHLSEHLPERVLPISTLPLPNDMSTLFSSKYEQVKALLRPGKRRRDEARGLIRTLLAMEAHVVDEVEVNETDVSRVEKAVKANREWTVAFPRLAQIVTQFEGDGLAVVVRISKSEGTPVRLIAADDPSEAAAIREVDLQKRFRYSPTELAQKLSMKMHYVASLKAYLGIDVDQQCVHEFVFGSQKHKRYSDTAIERLRNAMSTMDVAEIYRASRRRPGA